ncbi:MAG: hypothetical protein AAF907_16705 [Planctomycetota bacterium]
MAYKTVRELFDQVEHWRSRVETFCGEVAEGAEDDRVAAMMAYFQQHERQLRLLTDELPGDRREGVLNTWLQHTADDDVRRFFRDADLSPDQTLDEATRDVVEFDDRLREMYRTLAESGQTPPEVQSVFRNLLDAQAWQTLRNAWSGVESAQYSEGVA